MNMKASDPALRVGLKYCGHCQPRRDMVALMRLVEADAPEMAFERWSDPEYDVLLVLQACDVACAEVASTARPRVEVIVSTIDFVDYETDDDLAEAVRAALHKAGE